MSKQLLHTSIDRDKLPPEGISGLLFFVPENESTKEERWQTDRTVRTFAVIAVLTSCITTPTSISCVTSDSEGSSYFMIPQGATALQIEAEGKKYRILKNDKGVLCQVHCQIDGVSVGDAITKFISGVQPALDALCFIANTPLAIEKVQCIDESHHVIAVEFLAPYTVKTVHPHMGETFKELIPLYSLYSEAKNNASPYYKFLCYYKILEGIFGHFRPTLWKLAREQSITLDFPKEKVPDHSELLQFHKEYIGQPIKKFFDERLRPSYRNEIAHFLLEDGTILNLNQYDSRAKFANIILASELCARVVMENQIKAHAEFRQRGGLFPLKNS